MFFKNLMDFITLLQYKDGELWFLLICLDLMNWSQQTLEQVNKRYVKQNIFHYPWLMYCTRLKLFMLLEEKIPLYSLIDKVFQYIRINYWIFTFLVPRFPLSHSFTQHRAAERPFPLFTTYNTHNRENVHMYMILYNHETQLSIGQSPDIGVYRLHMLRSSANSAINKPAWSDIKYI